MHEDMFKTNEVAKDASADEIAQFKRESQKERNKASAKLSRLRNKFYTQELERKVEDFERQMLQTQNASAMMAQTQAVAHVQAARGFVDASQLMAAQPGQSSPHLGATQPAAQPMDPAAPGMSAMLFAAQQQQQQQQQQPPQPAEAHQQQML